MKGFNLIAIYAGLVVVLGSCSEEPMPRYHARTHQSRVSILSNKVSMKDAIEMASMQTKGDVNTVTVEPIVDVDGDTLMYFVNYQNGWKILSADKRTPAVIAESEVGSISLSTDNYGLLSWLEMTATDMKHIIHSDDSKLNFSKAQIRSHRQQWFKEPLTDPLRFQGDSLPILPFYDGEWELQATNTTEVFYDHINHLVPAHWDQDAPYNYYCPPKSSGTGNKLVGCSAVACGQMLQFLCSKFNIGFTYGWNGLYGDISQVTLSYPAPSTDLNTPLLLRYLGAELGANYGEKSTSVLFAANKIQNFYSDLHISCTKQEYSVDDVKRNLLDSLAVLVSGYSGTILGLPNYTNGHTYIIDGYKLTRTRIIDYYTRLVGYPPILEERQDTFYSSPHISEIKMNWGWGNQWVHPYYNDDWFALTGDWYVNSGENFTEGMTILCDFALDW